MSWCKMDRSKGLAVALVLPSALCKKLWRKGRVLTIRILSGQFSARVLPDLLERNVLDGVARPVVVIEVPPLGFENREALLLHSRAEHLPMGALLGCSPRVLGIRALRHFVINAGHGYLPADGQSVERNIDGAAAIVPRPLGGIGHELMLIGRCGVPEDF